MSYCSSRGFDRGLEGERFSGGCANNCLADSLKRSVGQVVTIFTASGGASGSGFTGLLVWADCDCVKLITTLPSAPPYPFSGCACATNRWDSGNNCNSRFGTVAKIPVCQIVSFIASEV